MNDLKQIPAEVTARLGFVVAAVMLFAQANVLYVNGEPQRYALSLVLSAVFWGMGALFGVLALLSVFNPRSVWLILIGVVAFLLSQAYVQSVNYAPLNTGHTDNEMIAEFALHRLQRGENPYTWNYTDMLRVYRDPINFTTHMDGSAQHRVTYPVLPTLVLWLFDLVGLGQVRIVSLVAHLIVLATLFIKAPPVLRPVILLPLVILAHFNYYTLGGVQDIFASMLLLVVVLLWHRPLWRGVLFGLVASFRQQPWFIAPFLLIIIWYDAPSPQVGLRRCFHFILLAGMTLVLVNLPFILDSPRDWLLSALEPSYALFDVQSEGLSVLWRYGVIQLDRTFFSVLQLSVYITALIVFWRHPRPLAHAMWLVPALFFWLYYRSLPNYWIYWIPPLLLALALHAARSGSFQRAVRRLPLRRARVAVTAGLVALVLGVNGIHFVIVQSRVPAIELTYLVPFRTHFWSEPLIAEMTLRVANNSPHLLIPRFTVQADNLTSARTWTIQTGPESLAPGETGLYTISANGLVSRMLRPAQGGQIVLNDASGNSWWFRACQGGFRSSLAT